MDQSQVVCMMYDEPSPFASVEVLERELEKVRSWPDSILNKKFVISDLEDLIAWKKADLHS